MSEFDLGHWLMLAFFGWLAWVMLKPKSTENVVCTDCGNHGPSAQLTRGSIWIEIILWLCLIIPGLIYSIWRHTTRRQVCSACGSERVVPPNTPVGRKLISENASKP